VPGSAIPGLTAEPTGPFLQVFKSEAMAPMGVVCAGLFESQQAVTLENGQLLCVGEWAAGEFNPFRLPFEPVELW